MRDEPAASIIEEALEGFASGRFQLQAEVQRFLQAQPDYPKYRQGTVHFQRVVEMMSRPIYAGYVGSDESGVSLRKGHHEPLISFETFQKIQDRLQGAAYVPARKDINEDFPLRGAVVYSGCDSLLTACWSKGRSAVYPYSLCGQKGARAKASRSAATGWRKSSRPCCKA